MHTAELVTPYDDATAAAVLDGIRANDRARCDEGSQRVGKRRIAALSPAADVHVAAARRSRSIDKALVAEADLRTQEHYGATGAAAALRFDSTIDIGRTARFDAHLATPHAVGADDGIGRHRRITARLEQNAPQFVDDRLGRLDRAAGPDGPRIDADVAAHQLTDVDGIATGSHFHLHVRTIGIHQRRGLAGGEDHAAVGGRDDAVVLDRGCDQVDRPAIERAQRAFVADAARVGARGEGQTSREEILVADVERGRHQPGHVDARTGPEEYAVRIDQEHLAVRLQRAKNLAGISAHDAVQHLARRRLLDEPGDFVLPDGERLPVDHRTRRVSNGQRVALVFERRAAVHDRGIERIAEGHHRETGGDGEGDRSRREAVTAARRSCVHGIGLRSTARRCPAAADRRGPAGRPAASPRRSRGAARRCSCSSPAGRARRC